ncbi:hypothetical protein, partial [Vibrio crassostreae]|uniref:hypothetical protein n=1 Tax=Vibrio crassostreae TaxID=246167 RepID=UPI00352D7732
SITKRVKLLANWVGPYMTTGTRPLFKSVPVWWSSSSRGKSGRVGDLWLNVITSQRLEAL